MKRTIIFCLFFLGLNAAAYCGQASRIELTDGSVINGEIISLSDGVYTINTPSLGQIKLEGTKVSKIEIGKIENLSQAQVESYGKTLMEDPKNAAIVTELAADSQFQELAKDPQIAEAAKAGDIQAIMKNEKFKVQMFRFVDVLPYLHSSQEVTRHLKEYFSDGEDSPH